MDTREDKDLKLFKRWPKYIVVLVTLDIVFSALALFAILKFAYWAVLQFTQ